MNKALDALHQLENLGQGYAQDIPWRKERKGRVLFDITPPLRPNKGKVNERFHRNSNEYGGDDANAQRRWDGTELVPIDPSKLKRASKKDLSASWSNRTAKVLRRGEADKAPPGRDPSQMEPAYQIERLEHNRQVQWRKLMNNVDRAQLGTIEERADATRRGLKLISVIGEMTTKIKMLQEQITRVNSK